MREGPTRRDRWLLPSGGPRSGAPGGSYPNRSDLRQAPRTAQGQTYGVAGQQEAAQRAIPLPKGGRLPPFNRPSERPDEPTTAGMPMGPGPGPEVLPPMARPAGPSTADELRALYAVWPSDDLRALLERVERSGQ